MIRRSSCLQGFSRCGRSAVVVPSADFGRVVGPVPAGRSLPFDGDAYVDAEHSGQEGSGELAGELEKGSRPGWSGTDTDLVEPLGELVGADRLAGSAAGEQPCRAALLCDLGVPAAGGDELAGQFTERFGKDYGLATKAEPYGSSANAIASRRRLALSPLTSSTIWHTVAWSRDGSTALTVAVTAPSGSRSGSGALK